MTKFLDSLREGPKVLPVGRYAMWFSHNSNMLFSNSDTCKIIKLVYQVMDGIETYVFAEILQRTNNNPTNEKRIALTDDLYTFSAYGLQDHAFVISVSVEKGIRFHFHESMTVEYINGLLKAFLGDLLDLKNLVMLSLLPLDDPLYSRPLLWWSQMESAIAHMEKNNEPVQAVGEIIL